MRAPGPADRLERGARVRVLAGMVAVLAALAACGQPSGPGRAGGGTPTETGSFGTPTGRDLTDIVTPSEPPAKTRPLPTGLPGVSLDAALRSTGSQLVAEYKVTNSADHPVVVIDRIPESLGSSMLEASDIASHHAWVLMAGNVVRVTKQAFPIKPDIRFIAEPVIGGHVLGSGASTTGAAQVPLPPSLDVPGPEFEAPRTPIRQGADMWQFCVQVAEVDQPREVLPVSTVANAPLLCTSPQSLHGTSR